MKRIENENPANVNFDMQERVLLPVDEGHQAFKDRKTPDDNPYLIDDWQHKEWQFGWDCQEQSNPGVYDWISGKFK